VLQIHRFDRFIGPNEINECFYSFALLYAYIMCDCKVHEYKSGRIQISYDKNYYSIRIYSSKNVSILVNKRPMANYIPRQDFYALYKEDYVFQSVYSDGNRFLMTSVIQVNCVNINRSVSQEYRRSIHRK